MNMKNNSLKESFRHAFDGIKLLLIEEKNIRIHVVMTILVIAFSILLELTMTEKAIVISLCAVVIAAELINTAIENAVNLSAATFNMYAKRAKDMAAAAVLTVSIGSAIAGLIIFIPHGIEFIKAFIF